MDGNDEDESLIELCESGFEREVYAALFDRGFRVTPQVKAGSFRIDMVIEGGDDARLAIECDGDEFHGPDRWQADMGRHVFWNGRAGFSGAALRRHGRCARTACCATCWLDCMRSASSRSARWSEHHRWLTTVNGATRATYPRPCRRQQLRLGLQLRLRSQDRVGKDVREVLAARRVHD